MKKGLMLIVLVAGLCGITKAQAQVEEVIIEQRLPGYKTSFEANPFWHNWFVSANFGANAFFAEHSSQAKFKNTITFMPELAVGKMFNPWWGLRLQGGGGALHGFTDNAGSMLHMHYMHMNIDFMMGLINFFAKYNPDRKFDIVPFFGVGGMTRKHQQSFTIHGGIQAKYKISERFDANIEFQGMIFNDKMVETGGFPNDGLGGLTAGVTYYFKGRGFRTAPKQAVIDEMAAANLVLANQVTQLQNRPPEIKVIEKEVVRPVETKNVEIVESIPSTIPFKFNSAVVQDIYDPLIYNIGTFMKNNPDVKIRISNGTTAHMLSDLKEGRTDVAVVPTPLQIEKPYSTVRLRPVRSILVGGPRFSALMDKPISLQELIQYPLAGLTEATMSHQFYENFFAAHGLPLNYDIELASADLLLPVVSHNLGLAFMPEDLAAQALSEKRIVSIPLTEEIPNRYICLVRDPSRPLGAAARCLIDMLLADRIG